MFHQYYVYTQQSHCTVKIQGPSSCSCEFDSKSQACAAAAALAVTANPEGFSWDVEGWCSEFLPAHNEMIRRLSLTPSMAETLIEGNERWNMWFDKKRTELLPSEDHGHVLYLVLLNSDPGLAGRGYGSKLLRAIQSKSIQDNIPIYLEATSQKSSELYGKFGFKLLEAAAVPALPESSSLAACASSPSASSPVAEEELPKVYFMRYDPPC